MKEKADLIIQGTREIITCIPKDGDPLGRINRGVIAVKDGKILAVGMREHLLESIDISQAEIIEANDMIVVPGFVDCHTHLVFGGSRVKEFALKMTKTVAEIERMGILTGIPASIRMTREASEDSLFHSAQDRLHRMLSYGTTTVESKSGYGIRKKEEFRQLLVNRRLSQSQPIEIISTFLGAHDFPPEIDRTDTNQRATYISKLIEEMIPQVAEENLAEFCDIYCDDGYYTAAEAESILNAGIDHQLKPKIHTDAYGNVGGSMLASNLPAVSADHLNYTSSNEMVQLAEAGVIGVVLPALDFAVAHPYPFNARVMIDAGMTLALGTNLNPGNWTESMQFVIQLACRNHGMSPEEAILAATRGAAQAIQRSDRIGSLAPEFQADIQFWELSEVEDIVYRLGNNAVRMVMKSGKTVFKQSTN